LAETQIVKRRYDPGSDLYGHKAYQGVYYRTLVSDASRILLAGTGSTDPFGGGFFTWPWTRNFAPYASENINDNAMQIDSCVNLFGVENIVKETKDRFDRKRGASNEPATQRWVIQPKFETPMMNFSSTGVRPITASAGTLTLPENFGSGAVPQGMWHQFGILPESADHGIFMEIGDIPTQWLKNHYEVVTGSSIYNNYDPASGPNTWKEMKSFANLMGFTGENSSVRMGEVANKQVIKEAVVAIPYIMQGLGQDENTPSGTDAQTRKKFIDIPKKRFLAAISETDGTLEGDSLQTAGASIRKLIQTMPNYVLPPQFDFLNNSEVEPIVMYFFEFSYELDQDDLSYIWQNLAPRNYTKMELKQDAVAHALMDTELINEYNLLTNENLRWMVFKVKQRSQATYDEMTIAQAAQPTRQKDMLPSKITTRTGYPLGYNWPYDYVSIIETIKLDIGVKYDKRDPTISNMQQKLTYSERVSQANLSLNKKSRAKQTVNTARKQGAAPRYEVSYVARGQPTVQMPSSGATYVQGAGAKIEIK